MHADLMRARSSSSTSSRLWSRQPGLPGTHDAVRRLASSATPSLAFGGQVLVQRNLDVLQRIGPAPGAGSDNIHAALAHHVVQRGERRRFFATIQRPGSRGRAMGETVRGQGADTRGLLDPPKAHPSRHAPALPEGFSMTRASSSYPTSDGSAGAGAAWVRRRCGSAGCARRPPRGDRSADATPFRANLAAAGCDRCVLLGTLAIRRVVVDALARRRPSSMRFVANRDRPPSIVGMKYTFARLNRSLPQVRRVSSPLETPAPDDARADCWQRAREERSRSQPLPRHPRPKRRRQTTQAIPFDTPSSPRVGF